MALLVAIAFAVISALGMFAFSALFGGYCAGRGAYTTEIKAKGWAALLRGSEVTIAASLLYVLWGPLLRLQGDPSAFYVVAVLYTLAVGGTYLVFSFFALITIPLGSQVAYFRGVLMKMR